MCLHLKTEWAWDVHFFACLSPLSSTIVEFGCDRLWAIFRVLHYNEDWFCSEWSH